MKIRCQRSKGVFMNRFLFAAWNIGFAFGAARLVVFKVVSKETKWHYEKVEKVEMAACVVGRARDCVHCSLTKNMLQL